MQADLSNFTYQLSKTPGLNVKALAQKTKMGKELNLEQTHKAAKEFEESFLTTMLEQMWTGIEADAPFGGGHAEKVYRSMMVGEFAKSIASAGGIGLADHVYREILSAQEGSK